MSSSVIYQKIQDAVKLIRLRTSLSPEIGVILGSGLGAVADQVEKPVVIPYDQIPHFHGTSVEGHAGRMVIGHFQGIPVVFMQGRFHLYEGYPMEDVAFPIRTLCALGIQTVVLTNAAGGVNAKFKPGDLMLIEDHLNLMGDNPLKGPNLAELGPRFPDLSEAYSQKCLKQMKEAAHEIGITIHQGVYAGLLGPTYETPAEIRMYRTLGADAVGMSTVPESIVANHLGVRVVGISYISNLAAGMTGQKLSHQEVMANSKVGAEKLQKLLICGIPKLAQKKVGA